MKAYAVYELEMEQLAATNSTATTFFASASAALGYVADSLPKALAAGTSIKEPVSFLVIAAFCVGIGVWNLYKRKSILTTIRGQSQPPAVGGSS
jgi:hypothetical protein